MDKQNENPKFQAPNKFQSTKFKIPNETVWVIWTLSIGIYLKFGICDLKL